jgi:spermidine synthase
VRGAGRHGLIAALLFLSGAAALAYEVLWARDWALLYGATAVGTAVVLAAYFAGLMVGAAAGARFGKVRRGLGLYAALEAGVAVAALAYLGIRPALPALAVWLAHAVPLAVLAPARALITFVVLAVPTTLLGATLPAATATLARSDSAAAGRLYAWNALGGVGGALAAGLIGIRILGVRGTFLAAAGIDFGVAALALALRDGHALPDEHVPAAARHGPRAALVVAALIGAAGLADEVLWTRGLASVLSNSVYSVALVLAAVLAGIVLGAHVGARLVGPATARRLAVGSGALAAATLLSLAALRALPALSEALVTALRVSGATGGLVVEATLGVVVVFVPAACLGALFPLALALAGEPRPGRAMGRVLAANTAGGLVGALGGAFVLLPRLGLAGGLVFTAAIALAAASCASSGTRMRVLAASGAAALALAALYAPVLQLPWRGRYGAERLLYYRDGAVATVMVTADAAGNKRLRVNSQYSLGGTDGLLLERREAHLPLLLHVGARRLLALGVGTGATVGAALAHPGLHADGVELVPEALAATALFADENAGVLTAPRARLVVDDARSYLLASRDTYDVILADLFLPWTAGTAYLYSLDFYRLGREHLAKDGIYCQWLPLHQLAVPDLEAIVASFTAAFPHVQLWLAHYRTRTPLAALIGSSTPLAPDADALAQRLEDGTLRSALADVGLDQASDLGILYVTNEARLATAVAGVPPITDDRPRLEFTAPAAYFHQHGLGQAALGWIAARLDPAPGPLTHAPARLRVHLLGAALALLANDGPAELGAYLDALADAPEVRAVRQALVAIGRERLDAGDPTTARRIAEALRTRAAGTVEAATLAQASGLGE